jgi:hypothetical protein
VVANRFDPGLKPPQVEESQLTLTYNFSSDLFGNGFVRATGVRKLWSRIVDVEVGAPGQMTYEGQQLDVQRWFNNPAARRDYKDLELDAQTRIGKWQLQGNIAWSELYGNGTGEAHQNPSLPYGTDNYNYNPVTGAAVYDNRWTSPYGRLATLGSPSPLVIHGILGYTQDNSWGKLTYGVTYRFMSGQHYDYSRSLTLSANPGLANDSSNVANFNINTLGTSEYMNGQRGTGVFNGSCYTDLSLQQDFTTMTLFQKKVDLFVKVVFFNVWNHQQIVSWDTGFNANSTGIPGSPQAPWTPVAGYGTQDNPSMYGDPRSMQISAGFKF